VLSSVAPGCCVAEALPAATGAAAGGALCPGAAPLQRRRPGGAAADQLRCAWLDYGAGVLGCLQPGCQFAAAQPAPCHCCCRALPLHAGAQVHPLIAQRWVGRLKQGDRSGKLQAVMCANDAYLPGRVNFSVRRASSSVDLIALLKEAADGSQGLRDALGEDFARWACSVVLPGAAGAGAAARRLAQMQACTFCTRARLAPARLVGAVSVATGAGRTAGAALGPSAGAPPAAGAAGATCRPPAAACLRRPSHCC
jgi:hypothetical protein